MRKVAASLFPPTGVPAEHPDGGANLKNVAP